MADWAPWGAAGATATAFIAAIVAFIKVRPETTKIVVDAAEGVVVIQDKTIKRLEERLEKAEEKAQKAEVAADILRDRVNDLETVNAHLDADNTALRGRVQELEAQVAEIKNGH